MPKQISQIHAGLGTTAASLFAGNLRDTVFVAEERYDAQTVTLSDPIPNSDPMRPATSVVTLASASGKANYTMNRGLIQRVSSAE